MHQRQREQPSPSPLNSLATEYRRGNAASSVLILLPSLPRRRTLLVEIRLHSAGDGLAALHWPDPTPIAQTTARKLAPTPSEWTDLFSSLALLNGCMCFQGQVAKGPGAQTAQLWRSLVAKGTERFSHHHYHAVMETVQIPPPSLEDYLGNSASTNFSPVTQTPGQWAWLRNVGPDPQLV